MLFVTRSYARGVWMPLICAICICLITLGIIILVDFVTGSNISLGRVVELMLDPGAFRASEKPATIFQLIITLIGAVVFTSLLITTVSNIFSNQAESYRNGEWNIAKKDHTLILGTNRIFYNSLDFFLEESGAIVVMTTIPAKEVRSKISSYIGSEKADEFIIISGDRRFFKNLERVSFSKAKNIYILGEDDEKDHDAANISCLKELCKTKETNRDVKCLIEIDSPEILLLFTQTNWDFKGVKLRFVNPDELLAANLLINEDATGLKLQYLDSDNPKSQHLVVIGTSTLSLEIAKLYLEIAHYPNFISRKIRSKLTIIDENTSLSIGLQSNLKNVCHVYEYGKGVSCKDTFRDDEYNDFLDFEINHITGTVLDEHVQKILEKFKEDDNLITVVISSNDSDQNFKDSISLPDYIYQDNCPVFVYQPVTGLVIDKEKLPPYYDNLQQFGLNISLFDVYSQKQTDLIRASVYAKLMIGMYDKDQRLDDELLDSHFMTSSVQKQSMILNRVRYIQYLLNVKGNEISIDEYFFKELHLNWMASSLLSVYKMMPKALWDTYNYKLSEKDNTDVKIALLGSKKLCNQLYDLTSYDNLDKEAKDEGRYVAQNIIKYLSLS